MALQLLEGGIEEACFWKASFNKDFEKTFSNNLLTLYDPFYHIYPVLYSFGVIFETDLLGCFFAMMDDDN